MAAVQHHAMSEEDWESPWTLTSRIAMDFSECVCDVLGCTPFGVPILSEDCQGETGEILKTMLPGPALRTWCCGGIFVAVNKVFWHDGNLNEIRNAQHFIECEPELSWGAEISLAVLRCCPTVGGWGGLPVGPGDVPVGDVSTDIQIETAAALNSDALAMMLAQECCMPKQGESISKGRKKNKPLWVPANVERYELRNGCVGNIFGWGRSPGLRVNLNKYKSPCASDCLALVDEAEIP